MGYYWQLATRERDGAGLPPGNQTAVQSSYHTATFADEIGSNTRTVFTDDGVTVNAINFTNTMGGSYRLGGGPAYNLIASTEGVQPSLGVTGGSHTFQAPVSIHADTSADIASGSTLIFDAALNLNGNTLTKTGAGTMNINNVLSTGGGSLVGLSGTIAGGGAVGGDLVNDGATVAPGGSVSGSLVSSAAVPEPTSVFLLLAGLLVLARQRPGTAKGHAPGKHEHTGDRHLPAQPAHLPQVELTG